MILAAGPIDFDALPIVTNRSNAMVPINGRPVISWILDDLCEKGVQSVTVVVQKENHRLREFLARVYSRRIRLELVTVTENGSIIGSLAAGLGATDDVQTLRVVLGDTLIRDSFHGGEDFVYVHEVDDSRRWCLAEVEDGLVTRYRDKEEDAPSPRLAVCGYYHFRDVALLRRCVDEGLEAGERELSLLLSRYGAHRPIRARYAAEWLDFGHLDHLVQAQQQLLQTRYFNTLTVNSVLNTVTKVSEQDDKLRDELDWYLEVPERLKVLTPRIVSQREVEGRLQIVQEYYGYPNLAELYLYGDLHADTWQSILRRVLRVHEEFRGYPGELDAHWIRAMYSDKTWTRLAAFEAHDPWWLDRLHFDEVCFNGRTLRSLQHLRNDIEERISALVEEAPVCVIHGDFCFSNILFDVSRQIVRLVDPRGRFGAPGVYGDARYDVAKLRHSVSGRYDYIVADMFELRGDTTNYEGEFFSGDTVARVAALFDGMLLDLGYDLDEVRFIEGLLFISMLPLHHGRPKRQQMMYLTGLSLLNDILG